MTSKTDHWDFQSAIAQVLHGRAPYPWGQALGLSHSQINNMTRGIVPKGATLGMICETERASGTWLLTGRGAPFLVDRFPDREAFQAWLEDYAAYTRGADLYVAACDNEEALITRTTVIKEPAGREAYSFEEIRVIAGILEVLPAELDLDGVNAFLLRLNRKQFQDLVTGQAGNQVILRWLENAEPLLRRPAAVAEQVDTYTVGDRSAEEELLDRYREMSSEQRQALLTIARGVSGKTG